MFRIAAVRLGPSDVDSNVRVIVGKRGLHLTVECLEHLQPAREGERWAHRGTRPRCASQISTFTLAARNASTHCSLTVFVLIRVRGMRVHVLPVTVTHV